MVTVICLALWCFSFKKKKKKKNSKLRLGAFRKKKKQNKKKTTTTKTKQTQNCPYNLIQDTTELCSLNFAIIKLLLPIYQYSQDSSTHFSNTSPKKKKKILTLDQNHTLVQPIASTFLRLMENSPCCGNFVLLCIQNIDLLLGLNSRSNSFMCCRSHDESIKPQCRLVSWTL